MRWIRFIAVLLGGLAIVLAIAGASYQVVSTRRDARRFPEPGRRVNTGSYSLKLNCAGVGSPRSSSSRGLEMYCSNGSPSKKESRSSRASVLTTAPGTEAAIPDRCRAPASR